MSRTVRLLVVTVAWTVPVVWLGVALLSAPSDGTSLSSSLGPAGARWGDSVRVARTYGDTPLLPGDEVQLVEERTLADWVGSGDRAGREIGDVVRYEVRRSRSGLDLIQQVDVTLERYDVVAAVRASPQVLVPAALLLLVGSGVFWVRSGATSARAFLAATSLLPAALASAPFGTGVIDLAGGSGVWTQVVAEVLAAVALVALIVSIAALVDSSGPRRAAVLVGAILAPVVGYAAWLGSSLGGADSPTTRLQVLATVAAPALWASVPALLVVAVLAHARARRREDVLATRLVLLGLGAGLGAWMLLGQVPVWAGASAPLAGELLAGLAGGVALACLGCAAAHYRLGEIEPRMRRGLVQALVLVVVGAAFVGLVRTVDVAADISVGSMLVGGLLALLLLPAAVAVQRAVRRLVYGDRASPDRVVSDLRRLDAVAAPEDALRQVLELLARRLHLSFAAVDVFATPTSEPIAAAIGTSSSATPATIVLAVGGATVGRLRVEVDMGHDPFGPGDRRLLEDIGSQVGALVRAIVANRELQQSRQRLVSTREEERRRLRRDLHDGLGPSLATLAMRLESATDLIGDDPDQAADLVAHLADQAREGIVEVRRLVEGLRPPALDQLGLVSALHHRAAEHSTGAGTVRVPWTVEADHDLEPLPAAVEVAAYRIVVEAVTNVQRHSGAGRCVVQLRSEHGELLVEVSDDGTGLAAERRAGVGLSSMRERAEELGGSFELRARPGGGTVIDVRLPLGTG